MKKHFAFLISVDGADEPWSTEAGSRDQAVFLTGVAFGQDNPELIMNAREITIRDKHPKGTTR